MARSKTPSDQLALFDLGSPAEPRRTGGGVRPAPASPRIQELGARLPPYLLLGGSTWSFPGWQGLVYDGAHTAAKLARDGLAAYAQHPLLHAVGIDRTHYRPLPAAELARYAAQVPGGFRFLVKAHDATTLARYPD
ncbi:MAG: DUF72 domain-containing protein, partial [Acidobacteriota bacterium]|nr:DUF72 domain-containing protein [Acidobacteriota bacterium]